MAVVTVVTVVDTRHHGRRGPVTGVVTLDTPIGFWETPGTSQETEVAVEEVETEGVVET